MIPEFIIDILSRLNGEGYGAFLVGGCVRDMLMGKNPRDWDIASSAVCEQVEAMFEKTIPTGMKYGTVTVYEGEECAEVTTFRKDGAYSGCRRPECVEFVSELREDLKRRDFTVNAMAMDADGNITDIFGGREDIENRIIRCVGNPEERFREDALRMFRAFRFAAVLGFTLAPETEDAILKTARLSENLSTERVRNELEKILMSENPGVMNKVICSGLLGKYFDESSKRADFSVISKLECDRMLRWSGFACILLENGFIKSAGNLLSALRLDKKTVSLAGKAADILRFGCLKTQVDIKLEISRYGRKAVYAACSVSDMFGGKKSDEYKRIIESGECCEIKSLAVSGGDILAMGCRECRVGEMLEELVRFVIISPEKNEKDVLLRHAEEIMKNGHR